MQDKDGSSYLDQAMDLLDQQIKEKIEQIQKEAEESFNKDKKTHPQDSKKDS